MQLATGTDSFSGTLATLGAGSNAGVPLVARVYLTLASWKRALSPGLDDDSIQGLKNITSFTYFFAFFVICYNYGSFSRNIGFL